MARSLVDLKDLTYFIAAYESRGFSRAAARLDTVQSNVSARIAVLERRLGVPLFGRGYRTLVPTRHGKKLYRAAINLVSKLRALERTAASWAKRGKTAYSYSRSRHTRKL